MTDFGAFVEVLPGIDGLVHVSQISHKRIENQKKLLLLVKKLPVKGLDVNGIERVSLIEALENVPAAQRRRTKEKRATPSHVVQERQEKRDFELPETQTSSQWLTCSVISNFNQIDNHKILCLKQGIFFCLFLIFDIIVLC